MFFMPVVHPASTFRTPAALGPLQAHVENFIHMGINGLPPRPKLEANPPVRRLRKMLRLCKRKKLALAVDVETGRFGHIAAFAQLRILGVGVGIGRGWGLSWDVKKLTPEVRRLLKHALADKTLQKVTMNGRAYDKVVLRKHGYPLRGPLHDIRDLRRALSSTSKLSLAHQASIYLKCRAWKAEVLEDEGDVKGYVQLGKQLQWKDFRYNAEDCVRTSQIFIKQRVELAAKNKQTDGNTRLIYEQMKRVSQVGADMMEKGFLFDKERAATLSAELTAIFKRERAVLRKMLAKRAPDFTISPKGGVNENDLRALLFRECKKPGIKGFNLEVPLNELCYTDTGLPAVNQDALLYLYSQSDTPDEVRALMKQCWKVDSPLKARSTYVDSPRVRDAIGPDGRVHGSVNTCAAETYRWSMSKPNLFNLSEEIEEKAQNLRGVLPNVRDLYIAPKGRVLVHRDWDQLELNVMSDYTGDKLLKQMLATSDPHTARARAWFNIPEPEEVPHMTRRQGKVVGFASQYAAGVETVFMIVLAQMPDTDFERVHALWATFRDQHVGIVKHWADSMAFAEEFGYNEAPLMGYRRYYPFGQPIKPTETSNYAIQSGAAAIANCTLVGREPSDYKRSLHYLLKKHYPNANIVMHVYDSFDIECDARDAEGVDELLEECMSGPWLISGTPRKFTSSGKIGQRWSEV